MIWYALSTGLQVHTLCIDGGFDALQTIKLVVQKRDAQTTVGGLRCRRGGGERKRTVSMPGEGDLYMGGMG